MSVAALADYTDDSRVIAVLEEQVVDSSVLRTPYANYEERVAHEAWQQYRLLAVQSLSKRLVRVGVVVVVVFRT